MLIGAYPADKDIYVARSPIHFVEKLDCAILLQQGSEDKVVPPNQAELMHAAVKAKGLPTALQMFEGEQHGFRKKENIVRALEAELFFFGKVFGYDAVDVAPLEIDNLA